MSITKINQCRLCGNHDLIKIFNLGEQYLASSFPKIGDPEPLQAPLILVKCNDALDQSHCGLLQLEHTVNANTLYCDHYGYRSGLNNTMISHLQELVQEIESKVELNNNDIVLDIGSNDCTLLKSYSNTNLRRVGIDPTSNQFKQYYPDDVCRLPTFFNKDVFIQQYGEEKAKIVTTISMFYDLPDPLQFTKDIKDILHRDGIWVSEQAYAPTMLETNNFDTILHEHLTYLCLKQFQYIADRVGLKIVDVTTNDCNACSVRITMTHMDNPCQVSSNVNIIKLQEDVLSLHTLTPLVDFINRVDNNRSVLMDFLNKNQNKLIILLGASTKGNVILQYYGIDNKIIKYASERNPEKYGRRTPGTNIHIISEQEARDLKPDFFLVLPWHFKKELLERERMFLENEGKIIFPMPYVNIYDKNGLIDLI